MKTALPYLIAGIGVIGGIANDVKSYRKSCADAKAAGNTPPDFDIPTFCAHLTMWLAPFGAAGIAVSQVVPSP